MKQGRYEYTFKDDKELKDFFKNLKEMYKKPIPYQTIKNLEIMTTIQYAEEWFKLHDIPTTIDDGSMYVQVQDGFELQLSTAEVEYRADLYKEFIKSNN